MANKFSPITIAVLVSPATHPVSGKPQKSASDAAAFELACSLAPEPCLTVLCAGLVGKDSLDEYLGLGASAIEVLTVEQGADVASALLARLQSFDLVICGRRSDGQSGSGLLPYLLADGLGLPIVNDVLHASLNNNNNNSTVQLSQFMPKGMRRRIEVTLPALLAVHPLAPRQKQYAYARARAGRVTYSAAPNNTTPGTMPAMAWQTEAAVRRPRPLKAAVAQSGHSRMLNAIGSAADSKAGVVVREGDAQHKAQILLSYLREHHLIDF